MFGIKKILVYLENTSVPGNTEVFNTLRCLLQVNIVILKLKYSLKLWFFFVGVLEKEDFTLSLFS
jgi:hypothetical protein